MNTSGADNRSFDEIHANAMRLAKESIAFNQQRIETEEQRWKAKAKSTSSPEVTHAVNEPLTVQQLYEARLTNAPAWDKHLEALAKEYDQR